MSAEQRRVLERLVRHYVTRVTPAAARHRWSSLLRGELEDLSFAWAGPEEPGKGHYYRILGRSFLIEYDNTRNSANHIHTVWRELAGDWGSDAAELNQ
jgi:hypothetical protein